MGIGPVEPGDIYIECPESQAGLRRVRHFSMKSSGSQWGGASPSGAESEQVGSQRGQAIPGGYLGNGVYSHRAGLDQVNLHVNQITTVPEKSPLNQT